MLILFLPPPYSRKTWIHWPTGIVRERSHMVGKEEEGRRKKPRKNHFAVTGIWTHGLCHQSRACYRLGHGALPTFSDIVKVFVPVRAVVLTYRRSPYTSIWLTIDTGCMQFGASLSTISSCILLLFKKCYFSNMHITILEEASTHCPVASINNVSS